MTIPKEQFYVMLNDLSAQVGVVAIHKWLPTKQNAKIAAPSDRRATNKQCRKWAKAPKGGST
jgi:hypothetical protein